MHMQMRGDPWRGHSVAALFAYTASLTYSCGRCAAIWFENAFSRRRILREQMRRPDRSRAETAAAIRTTATQYGVGAARTKRAFETADQCVERIGRQIAIAAFAVGAELEHAEYLVSVATTTKNRETPSLRLLGTQTTAKWSAMRLGFGAPNRRRGIHSAPDSSMVGSMNAGIKTLPGESSTDEVSDSCPEARGVMKNKRRDRERSGDRFSARHQASRSSSAASSRGTSCGTNWARSMDSSLTAMAG